MFVVGCPFIHVHWRPTSVVRCPISDVRCLTSRVWHLMPIYEVKSWTKCSTRRSALSFLCVTSLLRSVVSSPRCRSFLVSICHSSRRFVVSFRLFHRASLGTRKGIIRPGITWISWLSGQYGDLHQSVELIFNRVNEQFDESESEVSYLITHFDKVIYTLSRASSLFYVPIVSKSPLFQNLFLCKVFSSTALGFS